MTRSRATLMGVLLLPALCGVPCPALPADDATSTFTNPVFDRDRPDPGVLYHDGSLWMTHTMGGPPGWPLYQSQKLTGDWKFRGHLLERGAHPAWIKGPYWAPEFHRVPVRRAVVPFGKNDPFSFVIPFTCQRTSDSQFCVGLASAPSLNGPYTVPDAPLVVGAIDGNVFQDYDGHSYFLWRQWAPPRIHIRELNAEGNAFAPDSRDNVIVTPTERWEANMTEGPWMWRRGPWYYLFYSGNDCCKVGTEYAVGVARSQFPTHGFQKYSGNPVLKKNAKFDGPGHGAVLRDAHGNDWHYYHAFHVGNHQHGRVQLLDRIVYNDDEWPTFGNGGTPGLDPQPGPRFEEDAPPTVSIIIPSKSETVSGTDVVLSVDARDAGEVTEVVFYRWGPQAGQFRMGNAVPTMYGWVLHWDSTTVQDGESQIFAVATDNGGQFTSSEERVLTVRNEKGN